MKGSTQEEVSVEDIKAARGMELRNTDKGRSLGVVDSVSGDRVNFNRVDGRTVSQSLDTVRMKLRTGAMEFTEATF